MTKRIVLVVLLCSLVAGLALAFDGYVDITNKTGYTIYYIYVSHHLEEEWGEDLLGTEVLLDGDTFRVTLTDYPDSIFDILIEDEDGDTYTYWKVDVEMHDVEVTLADLD